MQESTRTSQVVEALKAVVMADDSVSAACAIHAARELLGREASSFAPLLDVMSDQASEIARLRRLAGSDELTGVHNRRSFRQLLDREIARLDRGGHGPAVLLLDLDGLKALNDTYGHAIGDEAICETASSIDATLRAVDVVARIGGDEFAVLLPETSEAGARAVAERVRRTVESRRVAGRPLKISVGWAVADRMGIDADALVAFADARLYADKTRRSQPPLARVHAA